MSDRRFDASQAARLDDPARLAWLPQAVVDALNIRAGDTIADIGAGTGYFALPLAQAAGAHGKVYAVDSQAEMLEHLRKKLSGQGTAIIELIHAEAHTTTLPEASCDLVFLANVWHEFPDRRQVLRESRRILKPGGSIAILDWRPDVEREAGPPLDHRLSEEDAAAALGAEGFQQIADSHAGKYSWLVQAAIEGR